MNLLWRLANYSETISSTDLCFGMEGSLMGLVETLKCQKSQRSEDRVGCYTTDQRLLNNSEVFESTDLCLCIQGSLMGIVETLKCQKSQRPELVVTTQIRGCSITQRFLSLQTSTLAWKDLQWGQLKPSSVRNHRGQRTELAITLQIRGCSITQSFLSQQTSDT